MASYLDSPMYQRMLAQTLQGNGGGPQYPAQAGANSLAQMLQAYSLKQYGQQADQREKAGNQELANAVMPPDYSVGGPSATGPSANVSFDGVGGPQQTTVDARAPEISNVNADKNAQLVALLNNGIGKEAIGKQALKGLGLGDPMDPKDRYMNVPGVGMVDLIAQGGPKPVVRERLKGGPGDVFLDQKDDGTVAPSYSVPDPNKPFDAHGNANKPYQDYELGKAAVSAPKTSVNVSADKSFGSTLGGNVANVLDASAGSAKGALGTIDAATQVRSALDAPGGVSTGPGATFGQFINQVTGNDPAKVANTRNAIQGMARLTVGARSALKGQGQVSDYEGRLLQKASSGDIDSMTKDEIRIVADVADRLARVQIRQNSDNVGKARKVAGGAQGMVDFYDVPEPPAYKPQAAAAPAGNDGWGHPREKGR